MSPLMHILNKIKIEDWCVNMIKKDGYLQSRRIHKTTITFDLRDDALKEKLLHENLKWEFKGYK